MGGGTPREIGGGGGSQGMEARPRRWDNVMRWDEITHAAGWAAPSSNQPSTSKYGVPDVTTPNICGEWPPGVGRVSGRTRLGWGGAA